MKKVYEVEFMEYTNCLRNTVRSNSDDLKDIKYMTVGTEPFLVMEDHLDYYREFGGGFRSIRFVGNMVGELNYIIE